jgi:cell division protein FtsN
MARDFKRTERRPDKRSNNARAPGSWTSFVTGLGIGLVIAVVVYFWSQTPQRRHPAAPVSGEPTPTEAPPSEPPVAASEPAPTTDSALPKFDFYKILPEIEIKVPEEELAAPTPAASAPPASPATAPSTQGAAEAYMLQVGSYQRFEEADQAKAQLALQGIQATIQRVVINGQDVWYRVHVGPYRAVADAQRMRTRLVQLGVTAIVLKLGGGA